MIHEVDSGCVGEAHFPAARESAELGHRLSLNGAIAIGGVVAVHADVLLAARIDPRSCASVMVNEVGSTLGGVPLLPSRR